MFLQTDPVSAVFAGYVRRLAARKGSVVLDAGTDRRFRKHMAAFRKDLHGVHYLALAYELVERGGEDSPDLQGDIQALPFAEESLDGIICIDVLEHVPDPSRAVLEMRRVLRPGAEAVVTVPFFLPYHGGGAYPDFWRFSSDAVELLFHGFSRVEVTSGGGPMCVARNYLPPIIVRMAWSRVGAPLMNRMDRLLTRGRMTPFWLVHATR